MVSRQQLFIFIFACLLGCIYSASKDLGVSSLSTAADKYYYCRKVKFSTLIGSTDKQHVTAFTGSSTNPASVQYAQLWDCSDDGDYSESSQSECGGSLPSSDKCQLIYSWNSAASAMTLPSDVGFKMGDGQSMDELMFVVKYNVDNVVADTTSIQLTYQSSMREHDAGVMTVGPNTKHIRIPANTVDYHIGNTCENLCATVTKWSIFSSSPVTHGRANAIKGRLFRDGVFTKEFVDDTNALTAMDTTNSFTQSATLDFASDEIFQIENRDIFQTECVYNYTGSCTSSGACVAGGDTENDERCFIYYNYYPRSNGIKSCKDNKCVNRSGNLGFIGNIILNYVAIGLAACIIGIIIGIVLYMCYEYIMAWFEDNSARFTLKNIFACPPKFFNPFWWFEEYVPPEDDEENKDGDKDEDDADAGEDLVAPTA